MSENESGNRPKMKPKTRVFDRTELERLYLHEGRSLRATALVLGTSAMTLRTAMCAFGIPRRAPYTKGHTEGPMPEAQARAVGIAIWKTRRARYGPTGRPTGRKTRRARYGPTGTLSTDLNAVSRDIAEKFGFNLDLAQTVRWLINFYRDRNGNEEKPNE